MSRVLKSLLMPLVISRLKKRGFSTFGSKNVFDNWYEDLLHEKTTTLREKLWAYKRGFLSGKISYYGLNEENYRHFLSDFDYYRLHPINGPYSKWIDDKLTLRCMLAPYAEYLPEYYFHLYQGEILRLMDCPAHLDADLPSIGDILRLLQEKGALAYKLKAGSQGKGFHKLAYDGQGFSINNQPSSQAEVEGLVGTWLKKGKEEYIITEYLQPHPELRKYYPDAPPSLRLIVIREKGQAARIFYGGVSFVTSRTGVLTNQEVGWVACTVDLASGALTRGKTEQNGRIVPCTHHPDTGVPLEGVLPHWEMIAGKISEICGYVPQLRYMGFDIIITGQGFKIIEINSHSYMPYIQLVYPLLKVEPARDFFTRLLEEKKQEQHSR